MGSARHSCLIRSSSGIRVVVLVDLLIYVSLAAR